MANWLLQKDIPAVMMFVKVFVEKPMDILLKGPSFIDFLVLKGLQANRRLASSRIEDQSYNTEDFGSGQHIDSVSIPPRSCQACLYFQRKAVNLQG